MCDRFLLSIHLSGSSGHVCEQGHLNGAGFCKAVGQPRILLHGLAAFTQLHPMLTIRGQGPIFPISYMGTVACYKLSQSVVKTFAKKGREVQRNI